MYFRNLRRVTVQCILQSTYHRTWETGLEVDTRVKETSNPLFLGAIAVVGVISFMPTRYAFVV